MNKKTAIITGATGYVGSQLAARLVDEGWHVHAVARPASDLLPLKGIMDKISVHRYNGKVESLFELFQKAGPAVVFHLASMFLPEHGPDDIEPMIRANILFGTQLAETMVRCRVFQLVNTGTSWQHDQNGDYRPVCLYAATKQAMDSIFTYYVEAASLKVITLKLFDTYGPEDPRAKLFTQLQRAVQENRPVAMSGGEQLIDLVYIDDVVDAYMLAAERLQNGLVNDAEEYVVSSGSPIALKNLVQHCERILDGRLTVQWGVRPYRPREVMIPWSTGKQLPGWSPRITLEEGMSRMGWGSR